MTGGRTDPHPHSHPHAHRKNYRLPNLYHPDVSGRELLPASSGFPRKDFAAPSARLKAVSGLGLRRELALGAVCESAEGLHRDTASHLQRVARKSFQGNSNKIPRKFHGHSKEIPRKFQ